MLTDSPHVYTNGDYLQPRQSDKELHLVERKISQNFAEYGIGSETDFLHPVLEKLLKAWSYIFSKGIVGGQHLTFEDSVWGIAWYIRQNQRTSLLGPDMVK